MFRDAGHLPKLRDTPPDPTQLPRQRRGRTPQMHGRYPDYDVLENARHWDETTREVVLARVNEVPPVRFFAPEEAEVLRLFLDVALAQDAEPRIPVLEMVDARLFTGETDGYRYDDMPEDGETWRRLARQLRADGFDRLADREEYVRALHDGEHAWEGLNAERAWSVVMRYALSAFYSHPWAWNEIGFGGPAYPRGYMRMGVGDHRGREPHEGAEAFERDPVQDS
ncbi:gluconate 2-dehydrogenase subunit 3 family protein [Candidatus Solirubrobacter pratensis]|uniref:gluconate 2-dehydrogenase subunit 3 family protein n=1 Tax=Candidatus Solirubrobacter pratensis TaxID=1298857 RepID=UPI00041E5561|nr:gluconate 2-dehydrogenase subunit 3 family protein [Candidatus Solirubrobacter pratensis]